MGFDINIEEDSQNVENEHNEGHNKFQEVSDDTTQLQTMTIDTEECSLFEVANCSKKGAFILWI